MPKIKSIFLLTILTLVGFIGCARKADIEQAKASLLQTDIDFSKLSEEKGMVEAFGAYMDDSAMMYPNRQLPIKGRDAIMKHMSDGPPATLIWKPFFADVASSGDLGYTLGYGIFTTRDSLGNDVKSYSKYVTIWKRQPDDSWKYVFDNGNAAPPPQSK